MIAELNKLWVMALFQSETGENKRCKESCQSKLVGRSKDGRRLAVPGYSELQINNYPHLLKELLQMKRKVNRIFGSARELGGIQKVSSIPCNCITANNSLRLGQNRVGACYSTYRYIFFVCPWKKTLQKCCAPRKSLFVKSSVALVHFSECSASRADKKKWLPTIKKVRQMLRSKPTLRAYLVSAHSGNDVK